MQLLWPEYPALQPEWTTEDVRLTFFKCVRWQVEETMDPINCPYHYYCDSSYPGNYPPAVDIIALVFTTTSYLATLIIMAMDISRRGQTGSLTQRYLLPSGPVLLPLIVLALAKGHRINTIFPLSCTGPSILLLIHISALSFDNGAAKDIKYVFLETSTISGILHASLYLDSIILPYYTGLDALVSSTFSGECVSCVCRKDVLVAGGKLVSYRGWSLTTFLVVAALYLRIISKMPRGKTKKTILIRSSMECLCWIFITRDCVTLLIKTPPERLMLRGAAFGGIFVLICLHVLKKACTQITQWQGVKE